MKKVRNLKENLLELVTRYFAGLRAKLILLAALPFLFFMGFAGKAVWENWQKYDSAKHLERHFGYSKTISALNLAIQSERSWSIYSMKGHADKGRVMEARSKVEDLLKSVRADLKNASFTSEIVEKANAEYNRFAELRSLVDSNGDIEKVIEGFDSIVNASLKFEYDLSNFANANNHRQSGTLISTWSTLENARNASSRLRDRLMIILSHNQLLNEAEFAKLIYVYSDMSSKLYSNDLELLKEVSESRANFVNLPHWAMVKEVYQDVVRNSNEGDYDYEPPEYWGYFDSLTSDVDKLISAQYEFAATQVSSSMSESRNAVALFAGLIIIALCFIGLTLVTVIRNITIPVDGVIRNLNDSAEQVNDTAKATNENANRLGEAVTRQVSFLEEVGATVDRITQMVNLNAENAGESVENVQDTQKEVMRGQETVHQMIQAIQAIGDSSNSIMEEVLASNKKISEVVDVISEIESKTNVINDIVFQTKLLSFNASVEAARAGEHGKGFSVVAEEVGNLARMSGESAKEIGILIKDSLAKVEEIVGTTKINVERAVMGGKKQVDRGTEVANECGTVFQGIVNKVTTVAGRIKEISDASKEQASGLTQISTAMDELKQVSLETSESSEEGARSGKTLLDQASLLNSNVGTLMHIVSGRSQDGSHTVEPLRRPNNKQKRKTPGTYQRKAS